MEKALIITSGGTTPVVNATIVGLMEELNKRGIEPIIGRHGLPSVYKEDFMYYSLDFKDINPDQMYYTPGSSIVGTSRGSITLKTAKLVEICSKYEIKYFFNIGGNGTIKQTKAIGDVLDGIQCVALPQTVDNDLGDQEFKQVLFTPGFPSVVNYWCNKLELLNNENVGAAGHDPVLIAQTFGRETGFIAGSVRLADPDRKLPLLILLPEDRKDLKEVIARIKRMVEKRGRCIVIVCEGYMKFKTRSDDTNQPMYGSSETTSVQELINLCMNAKIRARGVNYTVDQRQDYRYTTKFDLEVAEQIGRKAGKYAWDAWNDLFSTYTFRNKVEIIPLSEIPSDYSRVMREEWIGDFDVTDEYLKYLRKFVSFRANSNFIRI